MYYKLFEVLGQEHFNDAKSSVEACLKVATHDPNQGASYYMSSVGILTLSAIVYKDTQEVENMNKSVKQILSYAQLAVHQDCPDEILYGTAG